jgi:hypothetical protein
MLVRISGVVSCAQILGPPLVCQFGEERRRNKIIPHAFGERVVLKLMHAALIRATERWRGLRKNEFERRQLIAIRYELDRTYAEQAASVTNGNVAASPNRVCSKSRTSPHAR